MKFCIKTLLILFSCYYIGVYAANNDVGKSPQACLPLGEPCGIGINGVRGAQCCPNSYCVSEVCKAITPMVKHPAGGNPFAGNDQQPPPHPDVGVGNSSSKAPSDSSQELQCKQKLKNAGCGHNAITVLGPYCVCGSPDVVTITEQFTASYIPTIQDRIKLIGSCREYKSIQDCPQFKKQLAASPKCLDLKDQFTEQCKACGSRCTLLIEKTIGKR